MDLKIQRENRARERSSSNRHARIKKLVYGNRKELSIQTTITSLIITIQDDSSTKQFVALVGRSSSW